MGSLRPVLKMVISHSHTVYREVEWQCRVRGESLVSKREAWLGIVPAQPAWGAPTMSPEMAASTCSAPRGT